MSFGTQQRRPLAVRRTVAVALAVTWLLAATAALSEVFLLGIAERRVKHALARDATGVSVSISARPALKLLAGHANKVVVRIATLRPRPNGGDGGAQGLGDLLVRAKATDDLDVRIALLAAQRLTLRDVHLAKRGDRLTASAAITRGAIAAALPSGLKVSATGGSGAFVVAGTVNVLGRRIRIRATVAAKDGNLVVAPRLRGLALVTFTVFADPRVRIDSARAQRTSGGYRFVATGHLK